MVMLDFWSALSISVMGSVIAYYIVKWLDQKK